MKSIQDYISEGLLNKKNITGIHKDNAEGLPVERFRNSIAEFQWPKDEECNGWVKMRLDKPDKFVVYYDTYHAKKHISSFGGMLEMFIYSMCYEDFDPTVLIKGFKTLKDAVEYAVKDAKPKKSDWDNTVDDYNDAYSIKQLPDYYDSFEFCKSVLNGNIKEKEYEDSFEFRMFEIPTYKSVESLMHFIY